METPGILVMGLYAVFTHAIAERRREMAIRTAIGARDFRLTAEATRR